MIKRTPFDTGFIDPVTVFAAFVLVFVPADIIKRLRQISAGTAIFVKPEQNIIIFRPRNPLSRIQKKYYALKKQ